MDTARFIPEPVFATTRWTVVLHAGRENSPQANAALEELCRSYWYPLYAYVRRLGHDFHSAQDLTQEFFRKVLEKKYLSIADRRRGKFRWFLLTAFKCFLANEWDRVRAQKRGSGQKPLSIEEMRAEERYDLEPAHTLTADQIFDRRWALDLLERARGRLRDEFTQAGKAERFQRLEQYLPGEESNATQAETGAALGMTEGAVKQEAHRMKKRFGELLRDEVAHTVAHSEDVDEEIRYLIDVVCRR